MSCNSCGKPKCVCTAVITKQGLPGKRGAPGKVTVGPLRVQNTVYVMKNGNDSTGRVERFDKPFLTIAAAQTAALLYFTARSETARVRIVVVTGKYTENIILKKFIDFDLTESIIDGCISDDRQDIGSSAAEAWSNVIYGSGRIHNTQATGVDYNALAMLIGGGPNTKLLMYCDTLISEHDDCVGVESGHVRIHCNYITCRATGHDYFYAIECGQGFSLQDFSLSLVEIIGADISNASTSTSSTIGFNCGGASKNQILTLIDCRVKNTCSELLSDADTSAISVGTVIAGNGKLKLYNTVLYSQWGKSIFVNTGQTLIVYYYHSNMANVATGGLGTLTNALTTVLTVNAAVEAGF